MSRQYGNRRYQPHRGDYRSSGTLQWLGPLLGVLLALLMLVALGFVAYQGLSRSDFFQITAINIEGCNRVSKEKVLEWSGVDIHSNLAALSVKEIKTRLESQGWVEAAEVRREWPNRLFIGIRERVPVAMLNRGGRLNYLERNGQAFAAVEPSDDLDFPVISGFSGEPGGSGENQPGFREALQFLQFAARGNRNLPVQNISEINIGGGDELVVFLLSRPFPIRLGRGDMKNKYDRLSAVLGGIYKRREFTGVSYIDVTYRDNQVLVGLTDG